MSWKPRKCVIALLTLATLTCFAALIAVNIKPQHDAYPSSLSIKMGQDFSLGRNVNYFDKLKPNEENILMFWASWCQHCESLIEDMQQLDNFAALRKNLFTVSEDSTIEEASVHEGDFPIYIDYDNTVYDQYELEHIPSVFILDDQENIIGLSEGEEEPLALLKKYAKYNGYKAEGGDIE